MNWRLRSFGKKTLPRGAFVLLLSCACAGCASSTASRTSDPIQSEDSPSAAVEVSLGDEEGTASTGFPEGVILSAKRIFLLSSNDGGRSLDAQGGASLASSNATARISGERIRISFGSGWNVRVLHGTLLDANQNIIHEPSSDPPVRRTYQVRPGDTLANLAVRFYGDASAWRILYNANRDLLQEGELRKGLVLEIPFAGEPDVQVRIVGDGAL